MLRAAVEGVTLTVRAQPDAKKTCIAGIYGAGPAAQLKIAVHAPPLDGRANEALIAFLAETFDLPKRAVALVSGELSRSKVFLLRGITLARVTAVLAKWMVD
jgi:uncharacterized protein